MLDENFQKLQEILNQKEEESQGAASTVTSNNQDVVTIDELSNNTSDSLLKVSQKWER